MGPPNPAKTAALVAIQTDRLTSASTPSDAEASLRGLLSSTRPDPANDEDEEALTAAEMSVDAISSNAECLSALCSLIGTGRLPSEGGEGEGMTLEEGPGLSCELYLSLLGGEPPSSRGTKQFTTVAKSILKTPEPGTLVNALLDHLCSSSNPPYGRVLAMQTLQRLTALTPTATQAQLLSAPDGLNRLVDLLDPSTPEEIRNESILLATDLVKTGGTARLIIFSEGYEKALTIASKLEGGLTGGNVVVTDCLNLLVEMTKTDGMGGEILLGSRECLDMLSGLIDLRRGTEFLNPKSSEKEEAGGRGDDDLDDILKGEITKEEKLVVPRLTEREEKVLNLILTLIKTAILGDEDEDMPENSALKNRQSRQNAIMSHGPLSGLLIELALFAHPPPAPSAKYFSAVPSSSLQCHALDLMSTLARNSVDDLKETILGTGRLDRLMYLICTGGLTSSHLQKEKMDVSWHAVAVLRASLTSEKASIMIVNAIAPPMVDDENAGPPPVPVVQKLSNTLAENLTYLSSPEKEIPKSDKERMEINAAGSAGALGVFLTNGQAGDTTTREMLLRVPAPRSQAALGAKSEGPGSLMDRAISYLESAASPDNGSAKNDDDESSKAVTISVVRLLAEWAPSAQPTLSAMFANPDSVCLGSLLSFSSNSEVNILSTLTGLLLGLCMEYMPDDGTEYSGWSRGGILNILSKKGVGRYTKGLESMKSHLLSSSGGKDEALPLPWSDCKMERLCFASWYSSNVNVVRKRVVNELTGSDHSESSDDEDDAGGGQKKGTAKGLHKLLAQQSTELETLRAELDETKMTLQAQNSQMKVWKKRVESNPTELDEMLADSQGDNERLMKGLEDVKSELERKEKGHELKLKEKSEASNLLQEELEVVKNREREARDEMEGLKGEMEGLASAYGNLEVEYNRLRGVSSDSPPAALGGESSTNEAEAALSSLRAENEKLRNEAKAADDWMKMAVGRMQEMGRSNAELNGRVNQLEGQLSHREVSTDPVAIEKETRLLEEERTKVLRLESDLSSLQDQIAASERDLSMSKGEREGLVAKLERAESQVSNMRKDISILGDEATRLRDAQEQQERHDSEREGTVLSKLRAEKDAILALKERELNAVRKEIDDLSQNHKEAMRRKVEEVQTLGEKVLVLEAELASARADLAATTQELGEKDQAVRELEDRLASLTSASAAKDDEVLRKKDEEIQVLRTSNDASQKWMSQAVEKLSSLNNEMEQLQETNATLSREMVTVREDAGKEVAEASRALDEAVQEKDEVLGRLVAMEGHFEEERKKSAAQVAERDKLYQTIRAEMEETRTELEELRQRAAEHGDTHETAEALRSELTEKASELEALKSELESMRHTMESEVQRCSNELEQEQDEVRRLKQELDKAHAEVSHLESSASAEAQSVKNEVNELREENSTLQIANNELRESASRFETDLELAKETQARLASERDSHATTVEDLTSKLTTFQEWTTTAQQRISELESERDSIEESSLKREDGLREELEELKEVKGRLDVLTAEHAKEKERVSKIHAEMEKLEAENSTLLAQTKSLEEEVQAMENMNLELAEKAKENANGPSKEEMDEKLRQVDSLETQLIEKEDKLVEAEGDLAQAMADVETVRAEGEDVVRQWRERVEELEKATSDLEAKLEQQKKDANDVIAQWESRCETLEEAIDETEKELESLTANNDETKQELASAASRVTVLDSDLKAKQKSLDKALSELSDEKRRMEAELASRAEAETSLLQRLQTAEAELNTRSVDLEDLRSRLEEKGEALAEAEEAVEILTRQLVESGEESEKAVGQWKERTEELESNMAELESTIESQNKQIGALQSNISDRDQTIEKQHDAASNAISQWEARCDALTEQITELEQSEERDNGRFLQEEIASLTAKLKDYELAEAQMVASNEKVAARVATVEKDLEENTRAREALESELKESEAKIKELLSSKDSDLLALERSQDELKQRLSKAQANLASGDLARKELEQALAAERLARSTSEQESEMMTSKALNERQELEGMLATEKRLRLAAEECCRAESQAQAENTLADKTQADAALAEEREVKRALEEALATEKRLRSEAERSLTVEVEAKSKLLQALTQEKAQTEKELSELRDDASRALAKEQEMNRQLEQASAAEKGAKLEAARQEKEAKKNLEEAMAKEKGARLEVEKRFKLELDAKSKAEKALLAFKMQAEKDHAETRHSCELSQEGKDKQILLEQQTAELRAVIERLEQELQEANNALQTRLTDEISEKATEMATRALRDQMKEMRAQHTANREAFAEEQRMRLAAEREIERLKADLALLASAGSLDKNLDGDISKLTSKAAADIQRKERQEVEELRNALEGVLQELTSARSNERDAEDRAAKSRLHASVCEREAMAAKADLSFLTEAMEEMREGEMNSKTSLEYRINALEDDREILTRYHADEMESLKSELAQVNMEKERLIHSLNESEKANAALVYSTSVDSDRDGGSNGSSELAKLRLEKAQLLAAASEMGSRMERRIRESVATHASASEAEIILERELRETAEAALEDMQAQIQELKARTRKSRENGDDDLLLSESNRADIDSSSPQIKGVQGVKYELKRLENEIDKLKNEKKRLKVRLERAETEAKISITNMTEKFRRAEARARDLERDGHFEAAVATEVARIRAETSHRTKDDNAQSATFVDTQQANGNGGYLNTGMSAEVMHDKIVELKASINEERSLYRDLLLEHEDLLALLAQQDLERASLQRALAHASGNEAVNSAIQEAELKAVNQFGKYVRLG